ncbi:MAG: phospholipase D-like domain-containing protein, partial [Bacteroidota bacterium]
MEKLLYTIALLVISLTIQAQTIAEIQGTGSATPFMNQSVTTTGIVTAKGNQGYFIQDGTAIRSGIYVFDSSNAPAVGDEITLTATAKEFFDLTELAEVTAFQVNSSDNPLPEPIVLTTGVAASGEDYEGMLVRLVEANCTSTDIGFGEWQLDDGTGPCAINDLLFAYSPMLNTAYTVTGPLMYSFEAYKVEPRSAEDVEIAIPLYFTESPKETNITTTSLTVQWATNAMATPTIAYGLTPDLELGTINGAMGVDHELVLNDLSPATIYYVRPVATNGEGETPTSTLVMCTASNSSGQIKTYFNHSVDYSVATDELAVTTDHIIDTIISYIDLAQQTLDITMYEVENVTIIQAINAAYDRGVQVRYISDNEGNNDILDTEMDANIPLLQGNEEGIMHDKFFIIDREDTDNCWVMTGSMNHTEANLGWDYNNVICIQDQSLAR